MSWGGVRKLSGPVAEGTFESAESGVNKWPSVFVGAAVVDPAEAGGVKKTEETPQGIFVPWLGTGCEKFFEALDVVMAGLCPQLRGCGWLAARLAHGHRPCFWVASDVIEVDNRCGAEAISYWYSRGERPKGCGLLGAEIGDGQADDLNVEVLFVFEIAIDQRVRSVSFGGDHRNRHVAVRVGGESAGGRAQNG